MAIDFNDPKAIRRFLVDHVEKSDLVAADLVVLEAAVAQPDVSLRAIAASNYSDGDRALIAALKLVEGRPDLRRQAHTVDNLGDFLDDVLHRLGGTFTAKLGEDAFGHDPFAGRHEPLLSNVEEDGLRLTSGYTHYPFERDAGGAIDRTTARDWNPEALRTAIAVLEKAMGTADDPLTARLRHLADSEVGTILPDVHAALTDLLEAQQARIDSGAEILNDPMKLDGAFSSRRVDRADIDAIGLALAGFQDVTPPENGEPLWGSWVYDRVVDVLSTLSEEDERVLQKTLASLSSYDVVTSAAYERAGLDEYRASLLIFFRAIEEGMSDSHVRDMLLQTGSARALAERVLHEQPEVITDAITTQLDALRAEDPYGLTVGEHIGAFQASNIQAVIAQPDDPSEPLVGYQISARSTLTVTMDGVAFGRDDVTRFESLSIESLREIVVAIGAIAPNGSDGLAFFRAKEELARGGATLNEIGERASQVLTEKLTATVARQAALAEKLAPLAKITLPDHLSEAL